MAVTTVFLRSFYVGSNIQNILYGAELVLYFKTMYALLANKGALEKSKLFYALFSTVMVILITIWIVAEVIFSENMWLLHPNFSGGAGAYWTANIGVWYIDLAGTAVIALQLMTDALMASIYRCRMIWDSYRVIVVPVILWTTTLILGIVATWFSNATGTDFYNGVAAHLVLAYWSISVFLQTTLTSMICYRILRHGRSVQERLGLEYASFHFAIASVVIESILPSTSSGIAFLVTQGMNSTMSPAFIRAYFLMICISPQMLILRVATGKGLRGSVTSRPDSVIKFRSDSDMTQTQTWRSVGGDADATARGGEQDV